MCGIAGVMHRGKTSTVGSEMTTMLKAMKHRGPDSTGFALYQESMPKNNFVMRFKVAEGSEAQSGFDIQSLMQERIQKVNARLEELKAVVEKKSQDTVYACRYEFEFDGSLRKLANYIEDLEGVEILSIGKGLELIKDLGDADNVSDT